MNGSFDSRQKLTCLFCPATIEAVPRTLLGNRYRSRAWYANACDGVMFALCPEHQFKECHDRAWAWAKAKANPRPVTQEQIDELFA